VILLALPHSTNILNYPARFQFRQSGAPCGGSSCCTDTCIQMIIEYYKERTVSLSSIRWAAQRLSNFNEAPCTGINYVEVLNALSYYGINHYKVGANSTIWAARDYANRYGPVIVGVHYGSYPRSTSNRCGTTNRAEYNGKTDCGFNGAHAVLLLGTRNHYLPDGRRHTDFLVRDPDHNSWARPEKPHYDKMNSVQFNNAFRNLPRYTAFSYTYMIYPTRRKVL
jgi:hypothetical protein